MEVALADEEGAAEEEEREEDECDRELGVLARELGARPDCVAHQGGGMRGGDRSGRSRGRRRGRRRGVKATASEAGAAGRRAREVRKRVEAVATARFGRRWRFSGASSA